MNGRVNNWSDPAHMITSFQPIYQDPEDWIELLIGQQGSFNGIINYLVMSKSARQNGNAHHVLLVVSSMCPLEISKEYPNEQDNNFIKDKSAIDIKEILTPKNL